MTLPARVRRCRMEKQQSCVFSPPPAGQDCCSSKAVRPSSSLARLHTTIPVIAASSRRTACRRRSASPTRRLSKIVCRATPPWRSQAAVCVAAGLARLVLDTCRRTLRYTTWSAQDGRAPRPGLYCAELQASAPLLAPCSSRYITTTMSTMLLARRTWPHVSLNSRPKLLIEAGPNCPTNSTQVTQHRKVTAGCLPSSKSHLTSMRRASRLQMQCGWHSAGEAGRSSPPRMTRVLRVSKSCWQVGSSEVMVAV